MKKSFLYPDNGVVPVLTGEGYRDYLLSDVLASRGYGIFLIQVDSFQSVSSLSDACYVFLRVCFRIGGKDGKGIGESLLLLPLNISDGRNECACNNEICDIVVRYFYSGEEITNIAWVSVDCGVEHFSK